MPPINQELIAQQLNLSKTTVSRSLANHPAISPETRARVQDLAAQMGYRGNPSRTLRRPRQRKPITIGVIIGVPTENVAMATFPFILQGIRSRAEVEHLAVDVCYENAETLNPGSRRQAIFRNIRGADWRGTILIYPFPETAVETIARKISTVAVLENYETPGVDTIDTDDSAGIRALVGRLADEGHTKIGFLSWADYPVRGHWALRRFGGYVEALFGRGLRFNPEWIFNVQASQAKLVGTDLTKAVIERTRSDGVTAWVCAADHQAYHLVQDLARHGLKASLTRTSGPPRWRGSSAGSWIRPLPAGKSSSRARWCRAQPSPPGSQPLDGGCRVGGVILA